MAKETYRQRYERLAVDREPYLRRARECAKLTIPSLIPEEGHTGASSFRTPYQGLGARAVNNLSSKLLLALLPPNGLFFRLSMEDAMYERLKRVAGMERPEVDASLAKMERITKRSIETSSARVNAFEALRHLIVAGNILTYIPPEGGLRAYPLSQYVCVRDRSGTPIEIILKESVSPATLDPEMLARHEIDPDEKENVDIYTRVWRTHRKWHTRQELNDIFVDGSDGTYPLDAPAYHALRWTAPAGEHYGRGHVEEHYGDLKSYEGLSKAMLNAAAAASKVIYRFRPGTGTLKRRFMQQESGGAVDANENDIGVITLDKFADFRVALEKGNQIERRISQAFLLNSSVQRDAERVTAEEIRYLANELEDALGGVYSVLSQEAQLPWVKRWMSVLRKRGKLPSFPKGTVEPMITTGLEALGRNRELSKTDLLLQRLQPLGPEIIDRYLNIRGYIENTAASLQLETEGLIRSEEEIRQREEAAQQSQLLQGAGPGAIQELIKQIGQGGLPNG